MKINRLFILFVYISFLTSCSTYPPDDPIAEEEVLDPQDFKAVRDICVQNGNIYVASGLEGLYIFENEKWSKMTEEDGLLSNAVNCVAVSPDGTLYAGTNVGISIYKNSEWSSLTDENGLYSNNIKTLIFDAEDNLWIGSGKNRICKFNGSEVVDTMHVNPEVAGPGGHIHSICFDKEGNIWVGSCISGLSEFDGASWTDNILDLGVFVESSVCARNGDVWIGHISGAYQLTNDNWIKHDVEAGLANNVVLDIAQDKNEYIWVATEEGLSKFDGTQWTKYTTEDGLPDNYVNTIACDENGIWVGASGLVYLEF